MEQDMSNTPASKVRRPTSVGSVRWVGERASLQGLGPGLGPGLGEVGDTDIQTADTAAYLTRCRHSRPPKWLWVVPRRGRVGMGFRGLSLARVAGGMVGYIGACDEGVSEGCRSLFSPTCHDDAEDVRMGMAWSGVAKGNSF